MGKFVRDEELIAYKVRDTQLTRLSETLAGEAIYRFSFSGAAENDYQYKWATPRPMPPTEVNLHALDSVERKIFGMIILFRYLNH